MREFDCLKKVWKYAKEYKWYFVCSYMLLLAELIFTQALPLSLECVLDVALYKRNMDLLLKYIFIYLLLFLLQQLATFGQLQVWQRTNNKYIYCLREKCFENIINAKADFLTNNEIGNIIHTLNEDVIEFQHIMQRCAMRVVNAGIGTLISVIIVSTVNIEIAIIFCLLSFLSVVITNRMKKSVGDLSKELRENQGKFVSFIFDILNGLEVIKLFVAERNVCKKFSNDLNKLYDVEEKHNKIELLYSQIVFCVNFLLKIVFYVISGIYVINGKLNIPEFVSIGVYYELISKNFQKILIENVMFQKRLVSIKRVVELLELDCEVGNACDSIVFDGNINVNCISFSYDEKNKIFCGLSFRVNAGEMIGIVGPSGIGKTSLANLMLRFYEPNSGSIYIDGRDIKEYDTTVLRKNIGIVNQENVIFNLTVKNNICFGQEVDDSIIWNLLSLVNLKEEVECFPDGIKTYIGKGGISLSDGQKQRLVIARMLFQKPQIVILDEVTSALNIELSYEIEQLLRKVLFGKTVLVISHKLSILEKTDRILVINDGKVVEEGKYEEMIKNGVEFQKVFDI